MKTERYIHGNEKQSVIDLFFKFSKKVSHYPNLNRVEIELEMSTVYYFVIYKREKLYISCLSRRELSLKPICITAAQG